MRTARTRSVVECMFKDGKCGCSIPRRSRLRAASCCFHSRSGVIPRHCYELIFSLLPTVLSVRRLHGLRSPFIRSCVLSGGSGEILCALVNAIRPGTIPHVHESQLGFEQVPT